jgi:hypothetical protein
MNPLNVELDIRVRVASLLRGEFSEQGHREGCVPLEVTLNQKIVGYAFICEHDCGSQCHARVGAAERAALDGFANLLCNREEGGKVFFGVLDSYRLSVPLEADHATH